MAQVHRAGLLLVLVLVLAGVGASAVGATPGNATIEVRKMLVPATDPGKFDLLVRHTGAALITEVFNVGNNGHTARVPIPSGQRLTVEELHGTGTSLSNYASVLNCLVASGPDAGFHFPPHIGTGMILIANAGDNYTCTFTNTRKP